MRNHIGFTVATSLLLCAGSAGAKDGVAVTTGSATGTQAVPGQVRVEARGDAQGAIVIEGPTGAQPTHAHQYQFGPFGVTISTSSVQQTLPGGGWNAASGFKISDFWIGVECLPAPPVLRAQLKLPADQGLAVAAVVPEGPAAKAGIREHDVLLKVGEKNLASVPDLMSAVDAAKEQRLSIELLRAGERKKVEVQPAKRPAQTLPGGTVDWGLPRNDADANTIRQWMQQMAAGQIEAGLGKGPWQFHIMRPGAILPPPSAALPKLPADTTVVITRRGDEPAKIAVQKGAEHWDVTAQELDKLPAEIRAAVEPMLQPGSVTTVLGMHRHETRRPAKEPEKTPPAATPAAGGDLEKRLQDMNRKMEEMQKALEQMRGGKPPAKSPDEPRGARI